MGAYTREDGNFTHLALIIILGVKEYIFEDADSK